MILQILILKNNKKIFSDIAINEIMIMREIDKPMMDFEVEYNFQKLPNYKADGLVISTPTGSTAYNLSLNGPILFPTEHSFILNAMAPHALTHRPIVFPSNKKLEFDGS